MFTPPVNTRSLCCAVDARNYSSLTAADQYGLQRDLAALLAFAADEAGLARVSWNRQDGGDGELALLPPEQSESRLIDDFVRELDAALYRYNRVRLPEARLRLRVAIHFGVAFVGAMGYPGPAAVVVSRLLASHPLKQALETVVAADLVVGLSDNVYQDTVVGGLTETLPEAFDRHLIEDEKYTGAIWIRTVRRPGGDGTAHRPKPPDSGGKARRPQPSGGDSAAQARVQNIFNGYVEAGVIGVNQTWGDA